MTTTRDIPAKQSTAAQPLGDLTFIETQFPVSKMSKESYAERRANQSQTITGTGKWWGRKPLVLCRATILGLLLPATDNPANDRDTFMRLMTMDDDGMLRRKSKRLSSQLVASRVGPTARQRHFVQKKNRSGQEVMDYRPSATTTRQRELFRKAVGKNVQSGQAIDATTVYRGSNSEDRAEWFIHDSSEACAQFYECPESELDRAAFLSLTYDERLEYCDRPEQIDGPSADSWAVINAHLGTSATTLPELVRELGQRRFGHAPRVGDSFCGGGSIPFEAARIGCEAFASDLNPVAALLTWAALNIIGGDEAATNAIQANQRAIYDAVDRQITAWGIEHREPAPDSGRRWRADAYLYCTEVKCPECGWMVPMAPSWLVGPTSRVVAVLKPIPQEQRFAIEIISNATDKQIAAAAAAGTTNESDLVCPNHNCRSRTPIRAIRGDGRGTFGDGQSLLRGWENKDVVPLPSDIFQERLFCIRWVDTWIDDNGNEKRARYFRKPEASDLSRESLALELLSQRFADWQSKGYIPSRKIEAGEKTTEPIRTRGWTCWHHLFTPRQLLINGLFLEMATTIAKDVPTGVAALLGVGRCADWNSKLCRWGTGAARESIAQTFSNQALNTLSNYASKAFTLLDGSWFPISPTTPISGSSQVAVEDARQVSWACDLWITDPPYADAVNYHELSEFFLAWYAGGIKRLFPKWVADSRRALAVKGSDESFRDSMVSSYRQLALQMSENGMQVVMFTHQDPSVWADLAMILWSAGLRVSAAWCIQTEREASGTRDGNYVQGTVLLVLRKQSQSESAFLDEVYQEIESEVRRQLDTMKNLDDSRDPNFSDTDFQLAAYAAALRVLTSKKIEEIDVPYELSRTRVRGEKSSVEEIIEKAVQIACDHLVPLGLESYLWKSLTSLERLYVKGLELESHGEHRSGVYQELARGFGVEQFTNLLASTRANETRLKTATEFGRRELGDSGFGASLLRQVLFAAQKTRETEGTSEGITWLKTEVPDYGSNRQRVMELLEYLAAFRKNASMTHWHADADAAALLAGALRNRADNV